MTNSNFGLALAEFVDAAQAMISAEYAERYPNTPFNPKLSTEPGRVYVRIIKSDDFKSRSVYSFVRISDGAILYPAGWKKPFIAKGGPNCAATVRGNIYAADHGLSAVTSHGTVYVR